MCVIPWGAKGQVYVCLVCDSQVFFELLKLIKADKERHQSLLETGSKSAGKRSSTGARSSSGSVSGGPDGRRNSTKRVRRAKIDTKKKKNRNGSRKPSLGSLAGGGGGGRGRQRRRHARNVRRAMRRLLHRVATCRLV